ncbi:MAG: AAA family ATPase [Oscillospiraceae bacterium]|nr:AAA family ATPase [Oscillospiraceae bacterium]
MANKIIFASGKGGVGKSTLTAFIGTALTARGRRVLLIDADTGLGALDLLLNAGGNSIYNWLDVIKGVIPPASAPVPAGDNLYLMTAPGIIDMDISVSAVRALVSFYENNFDYILTDAPAGLGKGVETAAAFADRAVIVATADNISVRGGFAVNEKLDSLGIKESRLIINRFQKSAVSGNKLLNIDNVIDKTRVQLIGIIPEEAEVKYGSVIMKPPKANGKFMKAVGRIAGRVEGENIPLQI